MHDFKRLIEAETKAINQLHNNVHETFKNRDSNRSSWEKACKEFHSYRSTLGEFVSKVYDEKDPKDESIIEFMISFLELDPDYFRSGYIKEEILKKIKRAKLNDKQIHRLRNVLYSAIENRGSREFKRYCRLAPRIANTAFKEWLLKTAQVTDGAKKSRAKLMLSYLSEKNNT